MITPDTDAVMDGSLVIRLELQKRILPGPIDAMFWGENIWDCESFFIHVWVIKPPAASEVIIAGGMKSGGFF